jgi:MarR family transcriptional regulator, organic hydroperoxide resistance regulator
MNIDLNADLIPAPAVTDKPTNRYGACLLFAANALARSITAMGEEEFGQLGLAYSHAYLLRDVIDRPGLTPTQLSESLRLTPSTITRLVEKLELKQLVIRTTEGKNTLVHPTPAGVALHGDILAAWDRLWDRYSALLGAETARSLACQIFAAAEQLEK